MGYWKTDPSQVGGLAQQVQQIMVSTTDEIPGFEIVEYLGIAFGIIIRARGVGGACAGACQSTCGGEVEAFTQIAREARNDALHRLREDVARRGGNAVVGVKFDSSQGEGGKTSGIVAYGTAVRVRPKST